MKTILNTDNCKIIQDHNGFRVMMKMESGGWVESMPYSPELKGLIGALTLSIDVIAGKVWINKPVEHKNIYMIGNDNGKKEI